MSTMIQRLTWLPFAVFAMVGSAYATDDTTLSAEPTAAGVKSRAEVVADYMMWRRSGMAELTSGEAGADESSLQYRSAMARYRSLIGSPEFTQLVQRLNGNAPMVSQKQ